MTAQIIPFPERIKPDMQLSDAMALYLSAAHPATGQLPKRNPVGHLYPITVIRALYWRDMIRRVGRPRVAGFGFLTWVNDSDWSADWYITEIGRLALRQAQQGKRA